MRGLAVFSAVLLQACLCYGKPSSADGVGAFAYQDSSGNRYGGTYGLRDGQVVNVEGDYPPPPFVAQGFQDLDNFFPEYFRNLEYLLQEAFGQNSRNRDLAFNAAHKAYDLASNRVGYMPNPNPNFDFRFPPFGGFPDFGPAVPFDMTSNGAYAGAMAGPGYSRHIDAISPENPQSRNVDVTETQENPGNGGYYSVSSSSYATSSNVDGQSKSSRGSETKINNNGVVTHYKVTN